MTNFYTLNNEKLNLTITDIKKERDIVNETYVQITLTVSYALFKRVEAETLFNYHKLVRTNDIITFQSKKPVELKARLRSNLVKILDDADYSNTQILNAMHNEAVDFSFLNQIESWILFTATQEQDLPADLEGTGVLKIGISTKFKDDKIETTENRSPIQIAKAYLHKNNLLVELVNNTTVKTIVRVQDEDLDVVIFNNERQGSLIVYSMFPKYIGETFRTEIARMLIKTNYQLGVGAFEMDTDDGELRFRTAILYKNDSINTTLFENLFLMNIRTMEKFINDIFMKISLK
jgi:hypothetical protein